MRLAAWNVIKVGEELMVRNPIIPYEILQKEQDEFSPAH
jgi:hypothetical protein